MNVFRHWSVIDTFVYFSHHFVTIPPRGWTTAAHKHGVKVLGTVITEWDKGKELISTKSRLFLDGAWSRSKKYRQIIFDT